MRVLMVAANQEQRPDPVVPLGALYVAGAARAAGHDVALYDACFDGEGWRDALAAAIARHRPEVVGLSMRNVDDVAWPRATAWFEYYREVARAIRAEAPEASLVLGGSAFTLFPDLFVGALGADYGVVGEGESTFRDLLEDLAGHGRPARAFPHGPSGDPRLLYATVGPGRLPPSEPALDLADLATYQRLGGAANVQTKRGCGFACSYCTYPVLEGSRVRLGDATRAVDQIERMYRERSITRFFVVDNVFNVPASHALAFCGELESRRLPLRWTAYVTPAGLKQEVAEAMARSGCSGVEIGTEAAHPATLGGLGKSFGVAEIESASAWFRGAGVKVCHSLIFGGPGETFETMDATVAVVDGTRPDAVFAMLGVRLYPDTSLARKLEAEGRIRRQDIGLEPIFYIEEAVRDGIIEKANAIGAERPHWVFPGLDNPDMDRFTLRLRKLGVRGPLWELLARRPGARSGETPA